MVPPLLSASGLVREFKSRRRMFAPPLMAVDKVSLHLEQGECLGIVGESGSGKSTLGRLLLGLLRPNAGEVCFKGENIEHWSPTFRRKMRAHMALIPQNPLAALDPRMTIGRQIFEPMIFHNVPKDQRAQRFETTMAAVGLEESLKTRYPHQISGGQRQRVVMARALILNPSLLVFDEPVSALDVSIQAQILTLLNTMRKKTGAGFVFITHDLRVVRQVADRVAVMQKGQLVETGTVEQIISAPCHSYTQGLLHAVPRIPGMDAEQPTMIEPQGEKSGETG